MRDNVPNQNCLCKYLYILIIYMFLENHIYLEWLRANPSNKRIRLICKLFFQAVVYVIWRERDTRLHNSTSRSIPTLLKEVHLLIRAKLFGLDRNASPPQLRSASVSPSTTYLQLWFGRFQV